MRLIDISQEVFNCNVFSGDPQPVGKRVMKISDGDICNLTEIAMCAHNGTHVDAPFHFIDDGKKIDEMGLEPYVGECYVAQHDGDVTSEDASLILKKSEGSKRILIKGKATVTLDAAKVFADSDIVLIGNESQTVGPEDAPKDVHLVLLGKGITLLEGIVLEKVDEGKYFLSAVPLNLGGSDGAPCRAYLIADL